VLLGKRPDFVDPTPRGTSAWKDTRRFYAGRGNRPAWLTDAAATSTFDQLLEAVLRAGEHGLTPDDYGAGFLQADRESLAVRWPARVDPTRLATVDVRLTYAFFRLARDLSQGRIDPGDVSPQFLGARSRVDLVAQLEAALDSGQIGGTLAALAPTHPQYTWLQLALPRYRTAADAATADPIAAWRVRQIEMNMERWRWLPRALGHRHVLVNVPAYVLQAVEGTRPVLAMRVVVGDPKSPTPLFSDRMTYVVFSPYWNIPESILRAETLAQAAGDPTFFARAGIELVRVSGPGEERVDPTTIDWSTDPVAQGIRFRQVPGPNNALGQVKFIFPNHFDVYLHDTPSHAAFERPQRAYSHGCVRVEDPVALAEYVLRDQPDWTRARIVSAMETRDESVATLPDPIPVHLGYWTTWVEGDGTLTFTDDPYGLDERHDRALRRAAPSTRVARAETP
jgi:murein L,D-transpeptidase YcbB/YkuD